MPIPTLSDPDPERQNECIVDGSLTRIVSRRPTSCCSFGIKTTNA